MELAIMSELVSDEFLQLLGLDGKGSYTLAEALSCDDGFADAPSTSSSSSGSPLAAAPMQATSFRCLTGVSAQRADIVVYIHA